MRNDPLISAVVITRDRRGSLPETIESIKAQDYKNYEIVVVDNDSTDGTETLIKERFPEIIYAKLDKNTGVPYARNTGAEKSAGDIIFFIDDDGRILENNVFSKAAECFSQDHELAVMFGKCIDPETRILQNSFFSFQTDKDVYPRPVYTYLFLGGISFIRKEIFMQIGEFDGSFFREAEELDLAIRIHEAGKKILFNPQITLLHKADPDRETNGKINYYNVRNYLITYWKYFPLILAVLSTVQCLSSRVLKSIVKRWFFRFMQAVLAWLIRLPGIILFKRKPISKQAVKRIFLLNSFPFEDYSKLNEYDTFTLRQFLKIHRKNKKERTAAKRRRQKTDDRR